MIDDIDFRLEGHELDAVYSAYRHTSFPPGVLDAYIACRRRRAQMIGAEIAEIYREAAHDPILVARLNRPL